MSIDFNESVFDSFHRSAKHFRRASELLVLEQAWTEEVLGEVLQLWEVLQDVTIYLKDTLRTPSDEALPSVVVSYSFQQLFDASRVPTPCPIWQTLCQIPQSECFSVLAPATETLPLKHAIELLRSYREMFASEVLRNFPVIVNKDLKAAPAAQNLFKALVGFHPLGG